MLLVPSVIWFTFLVYFCWCSFTPVYYLAPLSFRYPCHSLAVVIYVPVSVHARRHVQSHLSKYMQNSLTYRKVARSIITINRAIAKAKQKLYGCNVNTTDRHLSHSQLCFIPFFLTWDIPHSSASRKLCCVDNQSWIAREILSM